MLLVVIWIAVGVAVSRQAFAQQPNNSTGEFAAAIPVEENTLAVLRLDLKKIKIDEITDWLKTLDTAQGMQPRIDQLGQLASSFLADLRQAGTDEIFVTMSTDDLVSGQPLVLAPTNNAKVLEQHLSLLWSGPFGEAPSKTTTADGLAIFGSVDAVDRISGHGAERMDRFDQPLQDRTLDHQLILSLPPEAQADLAAIWPAQAPKASPIEFSPRQLAADLVSLRIEWSLPPEPRLFAEATATATDRAAAQRIGELVKKLVELTPEVQQGVNVQAQGNSVRIEVASNLTTDIIAQVLSRVPSQISEPPAIKNLNQIGLALHRHHDAYSSFPPLAITDADGTPLLSWRVAILPFIEQEAMWQAIDRSKAWDDPANQLATETVIPTFSTPVASGPETNIRIPVIEGSLYSEPQTPKTFVQITDGLSNTIAAVVAPDDQRVPWTKPEVWRLDEDNLVESFFGSRETATVLALDGSVKVLKKSEIGEEQLRGLLTITGKERVKW